MRNGILTFLTLALSAPCVSVWASSGKTADGCSYTVINGKYVTSCEPLTATDNVSTVSAAPVTNYGAVPIRQNPAAPSTMNISIATPNQGQMTNAPMTYRERREEQHDQFVDSTYVGGMLGSSTITESGNASTGLGFALGTNLDDYLGIELGYAYAKQDTNLNLQARGGSQVSSSNSDSALASHLITAELQAHLTDTFKRLRPYAGIGVGWKSSSIQEETQATGVYNQSTGGGTLTQTSLGAIASVGTKFRLTQNFQLGVAFRYFLPVSRQTAQLNQEAGSSGTRLNQADAKLTGSSQNQFSGGLFYSF